MLARLHEAVLRAVHSLGPGCRANEVQELVSAMIGREQSFGSIFTTLDRLGAKGMLGYEKGAPDNRRGGRAPRLYAITGEGISALSDASRINHAMQQSTDSTTLGGAPVEEGLVNAS